MSSGVNDIDAPPPSPPESVAPPTSPHAPSSPTGSDCPPAGRWSGDVDDDATGLLEAQARALRSLLREPPSQDSWDRSVPGPPGRLPHPGLRQQDRRRGH
ncbi:hypothetical protein HPB50_008254 [Hyalomma asiaticum]|uniref:Uncharacterized protein n=1 Tax=Hyalomma asiaticum TaxID=266040 RepID=A0ACB7T8I3_HYAAI|nr:hypothetical protein HPB50_008254 [Hyalomma asiaticum]